MREIKFRAWDSELGFMVDEKHYLITLGGKILFDNNGEAYDQTNKSKLMQFTGLKDKNGKEIYEGDIIRAVHVGKAGNESYSRPYEVTYPGDIAAFDAGGCFLSKFTNGEIEVIGNIYENPELLGGKDGY